MSYAMVINFTDPDDNENKSIILDAISANKVDASSNLATHPMVSGDIIADHMIKQPVTVSFSGKFSTKNAQTIVSSAKGLILADVEKYFERIKNEGILCDLIKIQADETSKSNPYENARFSVREKCVLDSISWDENINTLGYTFSFTQIMLVNVETYDIDIDDNFLPYVTEPEAKNFTDVLFDQEQFDAQVLQFMMSNDICTQNFIDVLKAYTVPALIAVGVGAALAIATAVGASIPVVGVVVAVAAAIGILIYGLINAFKKIAARSKYKIKPFEVKKNKKKMEDEIKRFGDFFGSLHDEVAKLNNHIKVFHIAENTQQECLLTIGNNYYVFSIVKNNTNGKWGIIASDMNDSLKGQLPDITGAIKSIGECNTENDLFTTDDGYYVYVMRPSVQVNNEDENDLTNYYIVTSTINLEQYNEILERIFKGALLVDF